MMPALATRGRIARRDCSGADAGAYAPALDHRSHARQPRGHCRAPRSSRCRVRNEHGLRYAAEALARGAAIVLYEPSDEFHADAADAESSRCRVCSARLGELAHAFFATPREPHADRRDRHERQDDGRLSCSRRRSRQPQRRARTSARSASAAAEAQRRTRTRRPTRCTLHSRASARAARGARRDGSFLARARSGSDRGPALPHRHLHEPHARPPRRARRLRELRPREGAACSSCRSLAARGHQRRRCIRRAARAPICRAAASRSARDARRPRRADSARALEALRPATGLDARDSSGRLRLAATARVDS